MKKLRNFRKDEQGATMIIVAILLSVLLAFAAVVIDVGISYNNKTNLQNAADAVTLAVSTEGAATEDYNPVKNATQNIALRKSVYEYFKLNNIDSFTFDENDPNSSNIEVWSMARKDAAIEQVKENPDKDVALVFYKSTNDYQYIEVYAHTHSTAVFGKLLDFDSYKMTVDSAAKCQILFGGNPDAINYQILQLDPTKKFKITGPIENTGLKSFLDWSNNATNGVLKFLQEDTKFISKYIMGGKTKFTCPYCGTESMKAEAEVTNSYGNVSYYCPNCGNELSITDDSNAVVTTWTTSVAVLNGYIHANGASDVSIDSIRMNRALAETITCQKCGQTGSTSSGFSLTEITDENSDGSAVLYKITCNNCGAEVGTKDSVWSTYWNGSKFSSRPIFEICYGANSLNIKAGSRNAAQANDVYLVGDEQTVTKNDGTTEKVTRTLYKRGDEAQHADFMRQNHQFLYGSTDVRKCEFDGENVTYAIENLNLKNKVEQVADPGLTGYIHKQYTDLGSTVGSTNVGVITKQTSGKTHNVTFNNNEEDTSFSLSSNTTESVFGDANVNGNALLGKIDLGNNRSLPDVYATFDSYNYFDFDFDNDKESIKDVIDNTVKPAANAEEKDEAVAQIVANKRLHLEESELEDDDSARITIDRVITNITGVSHTESERLRLLLTKYLYYDIDIDTAMSVKKKEISGNFTTNENAVRNKTYLNGGVANTVTTRNAAVYNNISSFNSPAITGNGKQYFMEDLVDGKDGVTNTSIQSVNDDYYKTVLKGLTLPASANFTTNSNNFEGKGSGDEKDYMFRLSNYNWYTSRFRNPKKGIYNMGVHIQSDFNVVADKDIYFNGDGNRWLKVDDNAKFYILNSNNENDAYHNESGSIMVGNNSVLYINGSAYNNEDYSSGSKGEVNIGSNSVVYVNGNLTVKGGGRLTVAKGAVLVVNGQLDCSVIRAAEGSTIYCKSLTNGRSDGITLGNFYCDGNVSSYGMTVFSSQDNPANVFIGGNYKTNSTDNAIAIHDYGKVIIKGSANCGDITVNSNGGLYCDGSITTKSLTNKTSAVMLCRGGLQLNSGGNLSNDGVVYAMSDLYIDGNFANGSNAKTYCGGKLTINGSDETVMTMGIAYVGKNIVGNGSLRVKGILSVAGSPHGSDDPNLADYTEGIKLKCIDVYDNAQMYVRGVVVCYGTGFAFVNTGSDDIKAQVFIDSNGGTETALQTTTYLKLVAGAKLFVQGNANIKCKDSSDGSILNEGRTYLFVSDNLSTNAKINMYGNSLIHCGTLITPVIDVGVDNLAEDTARASGLMVDGYARITSGSFKNYCNTYIGGALICNNGEVLNDDNGDLYVNNSVSCTNIRFYDKANMFAYGNVTTRNSGGESLYLDSGTCNSLFLCRGNLTVYGNMGVYNNGKVLVKGNLDVKSGFNIGTTAMVYARGNIEFSASESTTENILYTDSMLVSNASSVSTLYYVNRYRVYPTPPTIITTQRNNVKFVKKEGTNSSTSYSKDVTITGRDYTIGTDDKNVNIDPGVTIKVVGGDIYIKGIVSSYGNIICLADKGVGGNIYIDGSTQKYHYAYLLSQGLLYCDKNLVSTGTNWTSSANVTTNFTDPGGRSITIGYPNNNSAELYVGGNVTAWASFDNFGKSYIAGSLTAGTDRDCVTYASGQNKMGGSISNDTGVAIDGEDNSVTLVGKDLVASANKRNTTVSVRSNAVLYTGGDATASRNFLIGNAFMSGGTKTQEGNEQFNYLNNNYAGLSNSVDGYLVADVTTAAALKVVDGAPSSANEISRDSLIGKLYDESGNLVTDTSTVKYVIYKKGINGKNSTNTYDFGFAYINGVAKTGTSSADDNWFKIYGKSVAYVNNKNGETYALKTRCLNFFPYARAYINGSVLTTGTPTSAAHKSNVGFNDWFYAITCINGNLNVKGQGKFRDGTKTYINGTLTTEDSGLTRPGYIEIGKAYDGKDEAYDPNNPTILQCSGTVTADGYIKIYARATLNATGSISTKLNYITLRHHANIRSTGTIKATQLDIGSGSNVFAGDDLIAQTSNIKIRDKAYVSVGGNGSGNLQALSYVEIGKREDEDYKYHSCAYNRQDTNTDYDNVSVDDGTTGDSGDENLPTDDDYNADKEIITCPECGAQGSLANGKFTISGDDNGTFKCGTCGYVFSENSDACDNDPAMGAEVYVNGTIKSTTSYLRLYANTQAYATKSVRSFKYITLRHHAGLYIVTDSPSDTGIMYSYNSGGALLDVNGNPLTGFYVETDVDSSEYGNVYFKESFDGKERKIYGFSIQVDDSESYDADRSIGYLYNNILYYYDDDGNKVQCVHKQDIQSDGETITAENYYYVRKDSGSFVLTYQSNGTGVGDDKIGTRVSDDQIPLVVTVGSVTSYGDLTLNRYANIYATGNITSIGKYYGGGKSVAYAQGNFLCTKLLDLSSLLTKDDASVCGFQLEHGAVRADKISIFSTSDIAGGVIDAVGNVNFNSIYTYYKFDEITCPTCNYTGIVSKFSRVDNTHYACPKCNTTVEHNADPYTEPSKVDLWICSENGSVDFNCVYSVTGGVTYAPNGTISTDGIYFEHYGSFIAGDVDINAFYINLHRLANSDVLDMKWPYAGETFLCTPESDND